MSELSFPVAMPISEGTRASLLADGRVIRAAMDDTQIGFATEDSSGGWVFIETDAEPRWADFTGLSIDAGVRCKLSGSTIEPAMADANAVTLRPASGRTKALVMPLVTAQTTPARSARRPATAATPHHSSSPANRSATKQQTMASNFSELVAMRIRETGCSRDSAVRSLAVKAPKCHQAWLAAGGASQSAMSTFPGAGNMSAKDELASLIDAKANKFQKRGMKPEEARARAYTEAVRENPGLKQRVIDQGNAVHQQRRDLQRQMDALNNQ